MAKESFDEYVARVEEKSATVLARNQEICSRLKKEREVLFALLPNDVSQAISALPGEGWEALKVHLARSFADLKPSPANGPEFYRLDGMLDCLKLQGLLSEMQLDILRKYSRTLHWPGGPASDGYPQA
ncbi:TPA: hypothetical protein ACGW3W_002202 [Pseudomonas aeruginosa]